MVAPDSRMNMASSSPVSVCSAQTLGFRSYLTIPPSKVPEMTLAVGRVVEPAEAGRVVVRPVGLLPLPPVVAAAVVLVVVLDDVEVVFVVVFVVAAAVVPVDWRHWEYPV